MLSHYLIITFSTLRYVLFSREECILYLFHSLNDLLLTMIVDKFFFNIFFFLIMGTQYIDVESNIEIYPRSIILVS